MVRAWRFTPCSLLKYFLAVSYSPGEYSPVPSALEGLTAVFGMGTGVSPPLLPPEICFLLCSFKTTQRGRHSLPPTYGQALDRLVPVRSRGYPPYTPGLSTWSSSRGLTGFCHGKPHLEVGFALRCFQRLSRPDLATQRCPWRDSWYTSGLSIPVLSY